ncbi:uncharacterized protein LOC116542995 [Sapajus apella]|uniref:Uncharacterized protein LOC116542995 n=1 Tax=Sapajus apella TaxID=9515 RepID=A0A6J3H2T9_SAPAP|nr:uncharacterized protein LOC116542995 [Sapajus apella]
MHSPTPNLLSAWHGEDPSLEILGSVLSHRLAKLSFRPRPLRTAGTAPRHAPHLPPPAGPGGSGRPYPKLRPRPATRAAAARLSAAAQPARPPASSLTREAAAASPLWLLSGFRTQAPTAAASTIPAADTGTARPPSCVPSAPEGAPRSPHRAPPPAAAAPAAMARSAGRAPSTARLPRSPDCGAAGAAAAAAAAAAGRPGARARPLPGSAPAGADAVTGRLCGLPRRPKTPPSAPPLPPAAAAAAAAVFGGGRAPAGSWAGVPRRGPAGRDAGGGRPQRVPL